MMCLTLTCNPSFAAATAAPGASNAGSVPVLPDAPAPQSTQQSTPQSVQQTVQQTSNTAINAVATTANQVAHKSKTLGERYLGEVDAGYLGPTGKWDVTVFRNERPHPFTGLDKVKYAGVEELSPFTIFDAAWSAGYEQLRNGTPHYGSDEGAWGERFGAAAFRQGTYRLFGDGVFPALLHEDPRYYRVAQGSLLSRGARSALQVLVSHRDDGSVGVNYSLLAGEAVANSLPLTFYPSRDVHASTVISGFSFSLLDDAALRLFREFVPDALRKVRLVPPQ
jgi:hypothetical protein